jgi:phospholipid/cholesterol/gamma-HCH transport system substrate-binding protein
MPLPREVKVGAFVFGGLVVAGAVVFLIGDERRMFESKVDYHAVFDDVQGLKPGSPVRMGGVDVGRVANVGYGANAKDIRLHVRLEIVESESVRIREDSVTTIDNKGLLGDKMVVIKVGSPSKPPISSGGNLPTQESRDFDEMLDRVTSISLKAEKVMTNLEQTTGTFADEGFRDDMATRTRP